LILLSLGILAFLLSFSSATKTDVVIDVSFVLEPNEKYEPPEHEIYHHTRIITRSTLMGEVLVTGGGINFTANGYNTHNLQNISVSQNYSFVIDPADDLYWFTFENIGNIQSSVRFALKEKWINIFLLIPSGICLLLLTPLGLVLSLTSFRKKTA